MSESQFLIFFFFCFLFYFVNLTLAVIAYCLTFVLSLDLNSLFQIWKCLDLLCCVLFSFYAVFRIRVSVLVILV